MENIAQLGIKVDSTDIKSATNELNKLSTQSGKTEKSVDSLSAKTSILNAKNAVLAIATSATVAQLVKMSDTWTSISSRLNLATKSTEEYTKAQQELFKIAQTTKTSLEGTVDLYSRIARSTESLKLSQDTLLSITETINKTGIISGATTQQMEAGLMQLGQAFSSGALRGEELNSILEQMPRLAKAIADGMNIEIGALKSVAAEGKITSKVLIDAITSQTDSINNEFNGMAMTIDQASTTAGNSILALVGKLNDATGASTDAANSLKEFSEFLDTNADSIIEWGIVAYASTSQLADGVKFLFNAMYEGSIILIDGVTAAISGVLQPITEMLLSITEALNEVGLSSDESVNRIRTINESITNSFKESIQGIKDSSKIIVNSYDDMTISAEDRIKMMTVEKQISMENAEMAKVVADEETKISKKKIELTKEEIKALKDAQKAEEDKNKALLEITQIGMNGYEKSLLSIADKLNSYAEAGLSVNQILEANTKLLAELNAQTLSETLIEDLSYYERKVQLQSDSLAKELELQGIAYSNAVLSIENSDKTIEQKEKLIALETELYDLSIAKLEEDANTEFQDTLLEFQDEALQRQIDLNQAMYDFSGSFEGIAGQVNNVSKAILGMSAIATKAKKEEIALNKKYTKEFNKYAGDVEKTKELEIQYTKESAELSDQNLTNQLGGYAALAGAMSSAFEQGSSAAKAFAIAQNVLAIATGAVSIMSAGAGGDPYTVIPRMILAAATVASILGSSGGGGGSVSVPSVADMAQETLDFENTMVIDRLDRQIELLEELNLQGSAAKLQVQSAGLQFDYEKATSVNNIRKAMEENVEKWGGQNSLNTFNGQISSFGFKGDLLDYFSKEAPEKLWLNLSNETVGGRANWMSQYIDITDRQFMEMRNEFQNKMSDFAINVIGTINNLKDTGKDLKETYDELTDSQKYANIDLMEAIKQVDKLRGERSFANYIEDEIENITKLEKELTPDRISLLLSEDIADMRAKVDLINYLSDQTGMAFENGAEDVLNYIDSIEAVSEMMTTSRENIKSYLDSFKTSEQLLQDLADTLNVKVANSVEELNLLFNQLSSDIYGLTDAELELLNANKDYLESIEELSTSTSSSTENIKNFINSLKTSDELLYEMSNTLGVNVATSAEDLADIFQKLAYDIDGLSDIELDYLNKNKSYIETLQKARITAFNEELAAVSKSISSIESIMNTLDSTIMKFRTDTMGSSYTLSSFYESMKKTLELSNSDDFDALSDSLKDTISYSAALFDTANFSSEAEMKYAQQVAANEFESMNLTLDTELDVLKEIETNTRAQVDAITESISALNANLLALIGGKTNTTQIPTAPEIISNSNRTLEEIISSIPDNTKSTAPVDLNSLLEVGLDPRMLTTDKNYAFSESQIAAWTPEAQKADALWKVQDAYTRILGEAPTQNALDVFSERYLSGELGTSKDLYQTIAVEAIYNGYKADEAQDYLNKVGIRGFANGGIITGPTLGLIGEAGYSEAVIPLKNPNDPLNQAALIGEVRALRSEVAYLNTLNEKQTATQIKTLSETRMIKGLSA